MADTVKVTIPAGDSRRFWGRTYGPGQHEVHPEFLERHADLAGGTGSSSSDDGVNLTKAELAERITAAGGEVRSSATKAELEQQLQELESAQTSE